MSILRSLVSNLETAQMWIVKTLGRRTRNGVDRVYSVNNAVMTSDLEDAVDAAFDVLREEMSGRTTVERLLETPAVVTRKAPAPQETAEYWNGTWKPEWKVS